MYENATISISPRLWFEETLLGATLNYRSSEDEDAVHFGWACPSNLSWIATTMLMQKVPLDYQRRSLSVFGDRRS